MSLPQKNFITRYDTNGNSYRAYKSGDFAINTATDDIIYYGRMDEQVKLNGYRIETGEIKHNIERHEAVKRA